jgi:hypothetical protein
LPSRCVSQRFDLIPVFGIICSMIRSFGDKRPEALFRDERVRRLKASLALPNVSSRR